MKRILCLWLPGWPIQRLVVARPELKACAIVLHARDPRRGEQVVACSAAARTCGIRPGVPLAEAIALASHDAAAAPGAANWNSKIPSNLAQPSAATKVCSAEGQQRQTAAHSPPTLHLQPHDPAADRVALEQLACWCERFSPLVGLEEVPRPDCLLMDITGSAPRLAGEAALAEEVFQGLRRLGYVPHLAIANTVGAAWAVAHLAVTEGRAKIGDAPSAIGKPVIVAPENHLETLRPLPLQALRLPAETTQLLHQLGIERIEQLMALPRPGLLARFGERLLKRLDQATGANEEVIVTHRPRPPLQAQWSLEHPTGQYEIIDQVLVHLTDHLAQLLAAQNRGAVQVECRLECSGGRPVCIDVGLFQPTAVADHLLQLIRMQLQPGTLPGPVSGVQLQAVTTAPLEPRQYQLLDDGTRDAPRQLALLIDRLSSRLGRDAVLRARLQAEALPEYACLYEPWTGGQLSRRSPLKKKPRLDLGPQQRPLRLLVPPLHLQVVAVTPEGPPLSFHYQNRQHRVVRPWGPERIETGWWRGRTVRRDYYRVEDQQGSRFWLFRRLADGQWFLHGQFD